MRSLEVRLDNELVRVLIVGEVGVRAVAGHVDGMLLVFIEHLIHLAIPRLLVLVLGVLRLSLSLMMLLLLMRIAEVIFLILIICVGSHMTAIVEFVPGEGRTSGGQVTRHRDIGSYLGGLLHQRLNRRLRLRHDDRLWLLHLPGLVGESHDGHDSCFHVLWLHWLLVFNNAGSW